MTYTPPEIAALVGMLSAERLAKLVAITGSQKEALEVHQQVLQLNSSTMVVVATVEIAIRNSVCDNLEAHFNVANWLTAPPVPFAWKRLEAGKVSQALDSAKRAEYSKLTQAQKAALDVVAFPAGRPPGTLHSHRARARRNHIPVSNGKVVAELTLYFWKRLFGPDYEQALWRPTLKRVFPDKAVRRADIASNLEVIYQARNRLAHHEPVVGVRFSNTVTAIEFIVRRLGQSTPSVASPLSKLVADDLQIAQLRHQELDRRLSAYKANP